MVYFIVLCRAVHIPRNTACVLLLISGLFLKPMWGRQNWLHLVSKNIKISREVELFHICISSAVFFRKANKKSFSPHPPQEILFIAEPEARMEESLVQSPLSALSLTGNICALPEVVHLHEGRGKGRREHMNFTEWVSWYKQEWFKHKHIPDIQVSDFASFKQKKCPTSLLETTLSDATISILLDKEGPEKPKLGRKAVLCSIKTDKMKQQLTRVWMGKTYTTQIHCFPVSACLHALHKDGKIPTTAHLAIPLAS